MILKHIPATLAACVFAATALPVQAQYDNRNYNAPNYNARNQPQPPANPYWQAPDWSAPQPAPQYRQQQPYPQGNYRPAPPVNNQYRGNPPPPPGPYISAPQSNVPQQPAVMQPNVRQPNAPQQYYNAPSAFHQPGYNPGYNPNRGSNWDNNKFWGRSGPGTWMNPNKGNMERGWDDMINSPSRMGRMPGGWSAPEVSMPNPVDIGDQMQDNVEDLPDQMRDMDVGN